MMKNQNEEVRINALARASVHVKSGLLTGLLLHPQSERRPLLNVLLNLEIYPHRDSKRTRKT